MFNPKADPREIYESGIAEGRRLERRELRKELKACFDRPTPEMVVGAIKGCMWQYHKQANRSEKKHGQ
jgi:hypothetical protein